MPTLCFCDVSATTVVDESQRHYPNGRISSLKTFIVTFHVLQAFTFSMNELPSNLCVSKRRVFSLFRIPSTRAWKTIPRNRLFTYYLHTWSQKVYQGGWNSVGV